MRRSISWSGIITRLQTGVRISTRLNNQGNMADPEFLGDTRFLPENLGWRVCYARGASGTLIINDATPRYSGIGKPAGSNVLASDGGRIEFQWFIGKSCTNCSQESFRKKCSLCWPLSPPLRSDETRNTSIVLDSHRATLRSEKDTTLEVLLGQNEKNASRSILRLRLISTVFADNVRTEKTSVARAAKSSRQFH